MKVIDRYLGSQVDLPHHVSPGRYRLLRNASLNESVVIERGKVLVSDGAGTCRIDGEESTILEPELSEAQIAEYELLSSALNSLAQLVREGDEHGLSPLLPASVGKLTELNELDQKLEKLIWHLQEIDRRPRFSMHYEEEISPLSRAKRISPFAINYLTAHSEDWHRRTLSGVQPKRILALYSEDDWTIYENRVFASLLRRLERYLRKRVAEVDELQKKFDDALNLSNAEELYPRLREALCRLWADALSVEETGRFLEASKHSLQVLHSLWRQVRTLRQGVLYRKIPRNAEVPEQLRDTNILHFDPHYRQLRTLWLAYRTQNSSLQKSAEEIASYNLALFEDYVIYIGMLARRVLADFKLISSEENTSLNKFQFSGQDGQFFREDDEWVFKYSGRTLTIVPCFFPEKNLSNASKDSDIRIPVFMFGSTMTSTDNAMSAMPVVVINPLEFFGLERLRKIILSFLWRTVFSQYACPISKLPSLAILWLESQAIGRCIDGSFYMLDRLTAGQYQALMEWLPSAPINDLTKYELTSQAKNLDTVGMCHSCGRPGVFEVRRQGFKAHCDACETKWGVWREDGLRKAEVSVSKATNTTFNSHGCWHLDLQL